MTEKFQTKKSLGQHFLNSDVVPRWMCDAGELTEDDLVVEVGPGTGALTKEILKRGAKVIALETDSRAIEVLEKTFAEEISNGQLVVHNADVRQFDLRDLNLPNKSFKAVANIPYYITGQLFRTFLAGDIQPNTLVFLVQKEVGKRATTGVMKGEKESLLSLSIQVFGKPKYIKSVGKGHFTPPPKVDSAIVAVYEINKDKLSEVSAELFFEIIHLGFGSKRKQLIGNLSKNYERKKLEELFLKLDLSLDIRGEDVPLEKWLAICKEIKDLS